MPDYIIKTHEGRNIVITANRYEVSDKGTYDFYTGGERVGSVNQHSALAVIELEEAFQGDFFNDPEDEDDVCQDCQFETQSFFEHVWSVIDSWHEAENESAVEAADPCGCTCGTEPETTVAVPEAKDSDPIEHWLDKDGREWWGFKTDKGFIHCSTEYFSRDCYELYQHNPDGNWSYLDLTGGKRLR